MVGVDDVEVHRHRPGMAVEAGPDQLAVVGPAVAGVGGRVDRQHRERPVADPAGDAGLLGRRPGSLPDREQREGACVVERVGLQRAHVVDASRREAGQLGAFGDPDRGLVEDAVDTGGTVGVGRDLGHEHEVSVAHGRRRGVGVPPAVVMAGLTVRRATGTVKRPRRT